jgi:hypothetical protein
MQDPVDLRTLFWKSVPITIKRSERDESFVELNVRLLAGYSSGSEALKVRSDRTIALVFQTFPILTLTAISPLIYAARTYLHIK